MTQGKIISLILIVAILVVGSMSFFTVEERQKAILFKFGEAISSDFAPGLHWKIPFVNNVRKFDARVQTMDAKPERYLTSEKKNLIVDSFVKWKIDNVSKFYTATGGDTETANIRLSQIIKDGLRGEFGKRAIRDVVSGERNQIMDILTTEANKQAREFGIDIIDVRIKRIDLDKQISESVYRRMEAERQRVAKELRAQGEQEAETIRAKADRERTVILAEAFRKAEQIRGEGDREAANIYAGAYSQDKEFYAFYRSLNAYRNSFANKDDILVLQPKSEFFQYFK
ncbi:MAG: protease modulator HflC [Gammaproteobacteria bacterium]|nr:protease modulator HflC [Gammaproteobacteria bacterium]